MSGRTPPVDPPYTADDYAGRTERGRQAYNLRRRQLREHGGPTIADLYNDDGLVDQADSGSLAQYWDDVAAAERANAVEDRAFQEQLERIEAETGPAAHAFSQAYARDLANSRD